MPTTLSSEKKQVRALKHNKIENFRLENLDDTYKTF